ncbi:MAG: hypothetical protein R3F62_25835 [Planctomycetota bacterium]
MRLPRVGLWVGGEDAGAWAAALRRALPDRAWGALLAPGAPASLEACAPEELPRAEASLVGVSCSNAAEARALLDAGALAALVHVGAPDAGCLWERGGARGVEPGPDDAAGAARAALELLRRRGRAQPRLGLLASGPKDAAFAAALAGAGVAAGAALDPYAAAEVRVDAWLCADPAALHTLLAFAAAGPRVAFGLAGRLEAWVPERAALALALSALAPLLPEPQQAPRVQVHARQAPVEDRCPFCHRPTESDAVDGLAGPPILCARCQAPHHRDCLAEHGGCAVGGCGSERGRRWGIELPLTGLAAEAAQRVAFEVRPGSGEGPLWVRVEAPIDDPQAPTRGRRVRLVLPEQVTRGSWLHGYVEVECARDFPVRGAVLELETTLSTRREGRREQRPIVAQRAAIVGAGASAWGRLGEGVASIFGTQRLVIPRGVRRYPIGVRIPAAHPATVSNRFKDVEESVQTTFRVQVGAEHAERTVEVV